MQSRDVATPIGLLSYASLYVYKALVTATVYAINQAYRTNASDTKQPDKETMTKQTHSQHTYKLVAYLKYHLLWLPLRGYGTVLPDTRALRCYRLDKGSPVL